MTSLGRTFGLLMLVCATSLGGCRSLVFHPVHNADGLRQRYEANRFEIASDGERIEGWQLENPAVRNELVLLYFGGNEEDVLYTAGSWVKVDAHTVFLPNYRGYGRSTGKPGERALYDDGLAIYDYVIGKGFRADQIVVMGRSLGSGVAAMLAGSRELKGVVLITPYDSISSVAKDMYPGFAVSLLIGNSFLPSVDWARKARAPALILAGERDQLIPPPHARRLAEAWAGKTELHVLPAVGHNNMSQNPDYYRLINAFLASAAGG